MGIANRKLPLDRRALPVALLVLACCLASGCMQYQFGLDSLYRRDIRTVHVRMFDSLSYRRYLGERLTEAVVKEIEQRTPYKVVGSPAAADSIMTGRIVSETKQSLVEDRNDNVREARIGMSVEVNWDDRRTVVAVPPELVSVDGFASLVPEVGQSVATSQQQAFTQLAARIVDLMETDWPEPGTGNPAFPGIIERPLE